MSHYIYITEAFVFKKFNVGEADSVYSFFTKEFGRLNIKAQGIRHLKSKLRYGLSGFSFLKIAFVATSGGYWRLIDVEETEVFDEVRKDSIKTKYCLKLFSLIDRLLQGEEKDYVLWNKLAKFFVLIDKKEISNDDLKKVVVSFAADIVAHLGYADKEEVRLNPSLVIKSALKQSML